MRNKLLDEFGELLIRRVRDISIREWDNILDGRAKVDAAGRPRFPAPQLFDSQQIDLLRNLGPEMIDATLHALLFMLEEVDWVKIALEKDNQTIMDIRDLTAGDLQGYLAIWAEEFSKERLSHR